MRIPRNQKYETLPLYYSIGAIIRRNMYYLGAGSLSENGGQRSLYRIFRALILQSHATPNVK